MPLNNQGKKEKQGEQKRTKRGGNRGKQGKHENHNDFRFDRFDLRARGRVASTTASASRATPRRRRPARPGGFARPRPASCESRGRRGFGFLGDTQKGKGRPHFLGGAPKKAGKAPPPKKKEDPGESCFLVFEPRGSQLPINPSLCAFRLFERLAKPSTYYTAKWIHRENNRENTTVGGVH